jgi:rare lipoprotein A (peptidoglycan hydrolase)
VTAIAVVVLAAGCGSSTQPPLTATHAQVGLGSATSTASTATGTVPTSHPQAIEPTAGQGSPTSATVGAKPTGSGGGTPSTLSAHPKLSGPASVTSAPAKGAPTDAQVKAALVSLQAANRRYRLDQIDFSGSLLDPAALPAGQWFTSIASFYDLFGNGVACGGILHPWTLGVANKTLPCGTQVIFQYGSRAIEVKVIDRGPYIAGREWDLTAATAVALHFPGLGPIRWRLAQ